MFNEAGKRGLARMLVINKLDADNIHFDRAARSHPGHLRQGLRAVQRPDRRRAAASAASSASSIRPRPPPAGVPGRPGRRPLQAGRRHRRGRRGPDGKVPDGGHGQRRGAGRRHPQGRWPPARSIPIFCTSAKKDIGIAELLDALCQLRPVAGAGQAAHGDQGHRRQGRRSRAASRANPASSSARCSRRSPTSSSAT